MSEWLLIQIQQMDFATVLVIGVIFWIFKSYMDKKFEKIDKRFENVEKEFKNVELEFKSVRTSISELDKRLVAIETTIRIQGGCRLNYDHYENKKID